ncbi:MAG: NAD(+) synthase [Marinilabiliaceae bacterium]
MFGFIDFNQEISDSMGFIKVAAATPKTYVANCQRNAEQIIDLMRHAADDGASIVALPELAITGYTSADLLLQPFMLREAEIALDSIVNMTSTMPIAAVIGMPVMANSRLYNCAVVITEGEIKGAVPKTYIPTYGEFYEGRWFCSPDATTPKEVTICKSTVAFGNDLIFTCPTSGVKFGIELCEDMWAPIAPSTFLALQGAQIIINISASNDYVSKDAYRADLVKIQSAKTISAYVYTSAGCGESTTDLVFGGATYIAENGTILARGNRYEQEAHYVTADIDIEKLESLRLKSTTFCSPDTANHPARFIEVALRTDFDTDGITRKFDRLPFVPSNTSDRAANCEEVFSIQTNGLAQRMRASHASKALIGVSGGLDSTLAILVAAKTMDLLGRPRTDVVGITMPGFGTTSRTRNNAIGLMKSLGVTIEEIDITASCRQHLADLGVSEDDRSVTYENAQARERTQILMDYANKVGGIVVGTGDLSELALGWATYNGDQMSMYGVNAGVPKTLVRYVVEYVSDTSMTEESKGYLKDILDTPISPELLPAEKNGEIRQKTEDIVGPYELHDFFLYHMLRFGFGPERLFMMAQKAFDGVYTRVVIKKWLTTFIRRFFAQQFKRSCMPDGPKVGAISLSPRGDWRMPSDATAEMWLNILEEL